MTTVTTKFWIATAVCLILLGASSCWGFTTTTTKTTTANHPIQGSTLPFQVSSRIPPFRRQQQRQQQQEHLANYFSRRKESNDPNTDPVVEPVMMITTTAANNTATTTMSTTMSTTMTATTTGPDEVAAPPALNPAVVLRFILPTLALWIAPPVMSLIDSAVVGRLSGASDLAALGPGCTLIDSSSYLFFFIATAATNMVAQANAEGGADSNSSSSSNNKVNRIVAEAFFLALVTGVFLTLSVLVAGLPMIRVIAGKQSADVVPAALRYSVVRSFGQPAVIMASVARAVMLAEQDTTGPLVSVLLALVLNAVGTYSLVAYANMGITGAAIGTLTADTAGLLFLLARLRKRFRREGKKIKQKEGSESSSNVNDSTAPIAPLFVIPNATDLRRFLRYAAPIFFTLLGKSVVYNGVSLAVGRLGATALAAHQVLLRSFFFWTPVGDSIGMTSQVFLPGILAEEKRTGRLAGGAKRLLYTVGALAGLGAATLAGLLPGRGAAIFTTDAGVTAALRLAAPILSVSVVMHAIALTCEGMLLAQRDLNFLSNSYVVTTVLTVALLLSPYRPLTLNFSWWILALFQIGRAVQFSLRNLWLSRKQHKLRLAGERIQ